MKIKNFGQGLGGGDGVICVPRKPAVYILLDPLLKTNFPV